MSKALPYHYRDNGDWCPFSNVTVRDDASCPNGCDGAHHHYANDGHTDCADDMPCGCPPGTAARQVDEHDVQCTGCGMVSA